MTSTTEPTSDIATRNLVRPPRDERVLRLVLATNATTSAIGGLVAALAGPWLDELLGTGHPGWVRLVGIGLVVFGIVVATVSRTTTESLPGSARLVSAADAGWVVFTIVTILVGWYSASGGVAMAVVGAMVATFGAEQLLLARRISRPAVA